MRDISSIQGYVKWDDDNEVFKGTVNFDRIKILRHGGGFEYDKSNLNQPIKFKCCNRYYLEIVYDGDFIKMYPDAKLTTIVVNFVNSTVDKFFSCEIKDIEMKDRITYLLVEAD